MRSAVARVEVQDSRMWVMCVEILFMPTKSKSRLSV